MIIASLGFPWIGKPSISLETAMGLVGEMLKGSAR